MTIDNHHGQDDQHPGSPAADHSVLALEQAALYATRLAIARWISNSSATAAMSETDTAPALSRAAWYASVQQNFQEWLGRGGFAQYDIPRAELAEQLPPLMTPTLYNVSKPLAGTGPQAIDACVD